MSVRFRMCGNRTTSRIDGLSVLVVSGVFTLWSLAERDWTEAGIGLLICAAGAIELRGRARLVAADPRGLDWLIASQVWLLTHVKPDGAGGPGGAPALRHRPPKRGAPRCGNESIAYPLPNDHA